MREIGLRNPILCDYHAALAQNRAATGAVSRRAAREARRMVYRRLIERHGAQAVLRHQASVKSILDGVALALGWRPDR